MSGIEEKVESAWFEAQGIRAKPILKIHDQDDMYRWDADLGGQEALLRMLYMRSGHDALLCLENALSSIGKDLATCVSLLEFAGGYGRVTRYLAQRMDPSRLWTSDVLRAAVDFGKQTFGVHGVYSETDPDRLDFGRRFDVIWVASLFSHLPRATFGRFLRRLVDALEPGGVLIFSTHGAKVIPEVQKDPSGFTFEKASESNVLELEDYGATFVTPACVREIAQKVGVPNLWHLEQDLWGLQDLFMASREDLSGAQNWSRTPLARGSIERAEMEGKEARIGGWVRVPLEESPLAGVKLILNGTVEVQAELRPFAGTLSDHEGGANVRQTDWFVAGPAGELPDGTHVLSAVATTANGHQACVAAVPFEVGAGK